MVGNIGLNRSIRPERLVGYWFILSIILLGLVASCSLIPGGKECDAVVKSFMEAAAAKDIDTAYGTMDPSVHKKEVEELILDKYYLFEGYQHVKMRSINVQFGKPHDTAEYAGEIGYTGGLEGWVEAELVKRGDEWKLTYIWVEVSAEKLADYNRRHGQ